MNKNLRFIIDVGVGRIVEEWLTKEDYDTISIRDINPRMPDDEILAIAVKEQRTVVTMDKDFGDLVFNSGLNHTGVLLLRLETASAQEKLEVVQQIIKKYAAYIPHKFCVFKDGKLRMR